MPKLTSIIQLSIYCPEGDVENVVRGIKKVTNLKYDKYEGVYWKTTGYEQFVPGENAMPTQGDKGVISSNKSVKLEIGIPGDSELLDAVLLKVKENHSWETPVIYVTKSDSVTF
ncbi:MAG: hypothetical protein KTR18_12835 [Acidiferrobacterales bacterium]|nr:hypothetical protein [Acidiferrobacterales bacterium]